MICLSTTFAVAAKFLATSLDIIFSIFGTIPLAIKLGNPGIFSGCIINSNDINSSTYSLKDFINRHINSDEISRPDLSYTETQLQAMQNYAVFYDLSPKLVNLIQIQSSSAGIEGWANKLF